MDRIAGIPVKQSQSELPLSFLSADCEIYEFLFSQVQPLIFLGHLRPVQTVMIVDDSFNYHARLNTNYHSL